MKVAKAPSKPAVKGKGLNGKIGPVPVKVVIFVGAAVVAYLLYRHYKGSQTTSAGSNATPAADSTIPFTPPDSTGGGASGGGTSPIDSGTPSTPNSFPPIFNFTFGSPNQPDSGGNVSTPTGPTAASSSQPLTSFAKQESYLAGDPVLIPAGQRTGAAGSGLKDVSGALAPPTHVVTLGGGKTTSAGKPKATPPPSGYSHQSKSNLH